MLVLEGGLRISSRFMHKSISCTTLTDTFDRRHNCALEPILFLLLAFLFECVGQFLELDSHRGVVSLGERASRLEVFQESFKTLLCGLYCDLGRSEGLNVDWGRKRGIHGGRRGKKTAGRNIRRITVFIFI